MEKADILTKETLYERRKFLEDLLKRRFFYAPSFQIYGGVAGLYDYGPQGCAIKTNIEQYWREHFILEEDMLEISATNLTPENVLKTSGHVEKFADKMVLDTVTGVGYRADKLIEEFIEKLIEKGNLDAARKTELEIIRNKADTYSKEEVDNLIRDLGIKSETGNLLSEAKDFNLMFPTVIGPSGNLKGYLRPETAQGIFVNFRKLLEQNGGRMPFAGAQLGLGFRNEIAPRSGLLRVREFQMAEIEHFCDPLDKSHPKFSQYADMKIPLYDQNAQTENKAPLTNITVGEAVKNGIIANETLAYFIVRTYLFLKQIGINEEGIRFRQHLKDEMAHYAQDCWDAEILTSYGWVECAGHADRACYDLDRHSKETKTELVAARKFSHAKKVNVIEVFPDKQKLGKAFKAEHKILLEYLEELSTQGKKDMSQTLEAEGKVTVTHRDKTFEVTPDLVKFQEKEINVMEEKYTPSVIEPSFGIGRIVYATFEHCFKMRDEKRTYLAFPPKIAPIKCSILPVISNDQFLKYVEIVRNKLKRAGISCKVDDSGQSIGRRYARTDEIGIPFGITVDGDTINNQTVTLREITTMKQVRISIDEVVQVLRDITDNFLTWNEVLQKYPIFESKSEE